MTIPPTTSPATTTPALTDPHRRERIGSIKAALNNATDPRTRRVAAHDAYQALFDQLDEYITEEHEARRWGTLAALCACHALVLGESGVGKTTLIESLAGVWALPFVYLSGTSDVMASDWLGGDIPVPATAPGTTAQHDRYMPLVGPVEGRSFVLADEFNRTPSGARAALLRAMQDGELVTAAGRRIPLPPAFIVYSGLNPQDTGIQALDAANADRFGLTFWMGPRATADGAVTGGLSRDGLIAQISRGKPVTWRDASRQRTTHPIFDGDDLLTIQQSIVEDITIDASLVGVIADLHDATQHITQLPLGYRAPEVHCAVAQGLALIAGRDHVNEDDVVASYRPVYRGRLKDPTYTRIEAIAPQALGAIRFPRAATAGAFGRVGSERTHGAHGAAGQWDERRRSS